jgi:hypothetical protein
LLSDPRQEGKGILNRHIDSKSLHLFHAFTVSRIMIIRLPSQALHLKALAYASDFESGKSSSPHRNMPYCKETADALLLGMMCEVPELPFPEFECLDDNGETYRARTRDTCTDNWVYRELMGINGKHLLPPQTPICLFCSRLTRSSREIGPLPFNTRVRSRRE